MKEAKAQGGCSPSESQALFGSPECPVKSLLHSRGKSKDIFHMSKMKGRKSIEWETPSRKGGRGGLSSERLTGCLLVLVSKHYHFPKLGDRDVQNCQNRRFTGDYNGIPSRKDNLPTPKGRCFHARGRSVCAVGLKPLGGKSGRSGNHTKLWRGL